LMSFCLSARPCGWKAIERKDDRQKRKTSESEVRW
jgi:hypothetical protein